MRRGFDMTDNVLTADFEELEQRINGCVLCSLGTKRTMAVPGNGSRMAKLMFIGEGPGYYEDQQGLPFVGRAGQLLNEMLAAIGMRREDVFVTNMIKCRAPNNRDPLPIEIRSCGPYLDRQIELLAPKVIVTLGRYSTAKFFPDEPIGKLRGTPANWNGIVVYPMYHPAARPSEFHHPRRPGTGLPQTPEPAGGHAGNRACHAAALRAAVDAARTPRRAAVPTCCRTARRLHSSAS